MSERLAVEQERGSDVDDHHRVSQSPVAVAAAAEMRRTEKTTGRARWVRGSPR